MRPTQALCALLLGLAALATAVLGTGVQAEEADFTAKLQQMVSELSAEQQSALLLLLTQLREPANTDTAKESTPEEAIRAGLAELEAAQAEDKLDLEAFMSHVSTDFYHPGVGDKEGLREWAEAMLPMIEGAFADVEISVEDTEYDIDGDQVEIYPIDISSPLGSVSLGLTGQRDSDGIWRITGADGV